MKYTNESGRSMVEMLGVLAIIGVLSVGGIAGYSKAMNKFKINKTTDQVSMLVANIRTIYSTQGNYSGLNNTTAINFGVVPNDMIKNGSLVNAFGGDVTITSAAARSTAPTEPEAFIIEYAGLSQEACVTIATGDWGSGQSSGLLGISAQNSAGAASLIAGAYTDKFVASASNEAEDPEEEPAMAPFAAGTPAVAVPGGGSTNFTGANATPMPVTAAVDACNGNGTINSVAWKYY